MSILNRRGKSAGTLSGNQAEVKRILVLGSEGHGRAVQAHPWDQLPEALNVADYEVVILNFTAFEDRTFAEGFPVDRLPDQSAMARLLFSQSSEVVSMGDPELSLVRPRMTAQSCSIDVSEPTTGFPLPFRLRTTPDSHIRSCPMIGGHFLISFPGGSGFSPAIPRPLAHSTMHDNTSLRLLIELPWSLSRSQLSPKPAFKSQSRSRSSSLPSRSLTQGRYQFWNLGQPIGFQHRTESPPLRRSTFYYVSDTESPEKRTLPNGSTATPCQPRHPSQPRSTT